jgi:hypothetical protein
MAKSDTKTEPTEADRRAELKASLRDKAHQLAWDPDALRDLLIEVIDAL